MPSRRTIIQGLAATAALAIGATPLSWARTSDFQSRLKALEQRHGGRLGVAALDSDSGQVLHYRSNQRFPFCSTFKVLAAAHMLSRVDHWQDQLERRIHYDTDDLVVYSPVTETHVDDGMTLQAIARAAVSASDNTAANLLIDAAGGTAAFNRFLHVLGDHQTRLDGHEPLCRSFAADSLDNTTTPTAMLDSLRAVLLGSALTPDSRARLQDWMIHSTTGADRLRAGLPDHWRVGDKTGSGCHATANDVAIAWPSDTTPPWLIVAYYTGSKASKTQQNAVVSEIGKLVGEQTEHLT